MAAMTLRTQGATMTDDDDSLVEFGEDPASYRRRTRTRPDVTTGMIAAGAVIGLAGVGRAMTIGFTPVTWTLLGVALPLAVIPVVRIARI